MTYRRTVFGLLTVEMSRSRFFHPPDPNPKKKVGPSTFVLVSINVNNDSRTSKLSHLFSVKTKEHHRSLYYRVYKVQFGFFVGLKGYGSGSKFSAPFF